LPCPGWHSNSSASEPAPPSRRSPARRYRRRGAAPGPGQVRAAAHFGTVYRDKHDLVSDDINLLFRMLDAKPLKADLDSTGAGLALAISADMYDSLVRRRPDLVGPGPLRHVRTTVKGTRINAWLHVPGAPQPLQRRRAVPVVSCELGTVGAGCRSAGQARRTGPDRTDVASRSRTSATTPLADVLAEQAALDG
jgi:hypothetical protein